MNTFFKLTGLWFLANILLAVVMFVGGFDFTFPQEGTQANVSYFFYAMMELIVSFVYLVCVAECVINLNKQD